MHKATRDMIIIIACMLAVGFGMMFYTNYTNDVLRQDFTEVLQDMDARFASEIGNVRHDVSSLGSNLSSQIDLLDTSIENFKQENQREIQTLSELIDEIERQSNIQLNELKDDLKNIKVQSADFSAIVEDVLESVVSIQTNLGQGSGVIVDDRGFIVTNVHVIDKATSVRAILYDGRRINIESLIGYDADADIAVLKMTAPNLKELEFGNSGNLKVGQRVIAAGNPAGLDFTVTEGIVSAFRKEKGIDYVQTDVPINPGNSGGPLINIAGEIVGINNFKIGGFESLGFAIASNEVDDIVGGIISDYYQNQ